MDLALQTIVENILIQKPFKTLQRGDKFSLTEQSKPTYEKVFSFRVINLKTGVEEAIKDADNIIVHFFPKHII